MTGPFSTGREASEAGKAWPVGGQDGPAASLAMLMDACLGSGVQLGAWDARIVEWLAGFEPSTCAVIAGLICRAHQAGRQDGEPAR
jgi:hypothetical protein